MDLPDMDWENVKAYRCYPNLQLEDFDRYAHRRRTPPTYWEPETFPFDYHLLPKLPRIHDPRNILLSRTHRSLAELRVTTEGPHTDPEKECYNFLETVGDAALRWLGTKAVVKSGCAVGEDIHNIRELLTNNVTLSYLASAYRLDHTVRHRIELSELPQKMMGDLFEAYVGAVWTEAMEDGKEEWFNDWIMSVYDPDIWVDWMPMQEGMAANGMNKRLARIKHNQERNSKKKKVKAEKKRRAFSGMESGLERPTPFLPDTPQLTTPLVNASDLSSSILQTPSLKPPAEPLRKRRRDETN